MSRAGGGPRLLSFARQAEAAQMIIALIGVSGSGKSTIGKRLAHACNFRFYEGDDYHSEESKQKMERGIALNDADREPWLARLDALVSGILARKENAVLAYSGLKRAYRQALRHPGVTFVYLKGEFQLLRARLLQRKGHFFDPSLLSSQFETLEEPQNAVVIDVAQPPEAIVDEIVQRLEPMISTAPSRPA
jgi:gluconokinase